MRRKTLELTGEHLVEGLSDQSDKSGPKTRGIRRGIKLRGYMFWVTPEESDLLDELCRVTRVEGNARPPSRSDMVRLLADSGGPA